MDFGLSAWMLYTMQAVFGLMILNFLIQFIQMFWKGSFDTSFVLDYLKDIVYFVLPLNLLISMNSIDPTGWIMITFYFIGGLAVVIKYLLDIKNKLVK
ncbi:hypothetical protein V7161_04660 [Neobacillus drentensis]|uniref:hypothetical protein n=1 Tax=Bacillales TaxID=1385 RepID=UPI0025AFCA50|nr:hypothetical protein [Paenibacillus sp. BSR1-1]MDN3016055.1 hypothetical protein [Paenibacillus sp. BSR1-1]